MTTPILTLAEVQALAGFTEGPWRMSIENGGGVVAGHRHAIVSAYSSPLGWPCTQVEQASKPLLLAAPALHATCLHLHAEVARLTAELEKPVAGPWQWHWGANTSSRFGLDGRVIYSVYEGGKHWCDHTDNKKIHEGGMREADLHFAATHRLVGGVFGEVSDGT